MKFDVALVWLHVAGNVLWIGSIIAVALLVLAKQAHDDAQTRGKLALHVYMRAAVPGMALSVLLGFVRLMMDTGYYLKEHHWMHGKLLFAVAAIAIHHIIGARAKKMAAGEVKDAGPTGTLLAIFGVSVLAALFFVIFRVPD